MIPNKHRAMKHPVHVSQGPLPPHPEGGWVSGAEPPAPKALWPRVDVLVQRSKDMVRTDVYSHNVFVH